MNAINNITIGHPERLRKPVGYTMLAIWLAASSAVLHDPALKLYFQKKRDEGKPYMASVGHACRKMVSIIYAVMRDNKAYTPYIPNEISA